MVTLDEINPTDSMVEDYLDLICEDMTVNVVESINGVIPKSQSCYYPQYGAQMMPM